MCRRNFTFLSLLLSSLSFFSASTLVEGLESSSFFTVGANGDSIGIIPCIDLHYAKTSKSVFVP
jgi:hypothetical protein